MILDIHSHHIAPYPQGIIAVDPVRNTDFAPAGDQLYSIGIHPWTTTDPITDIDLKRLEELGKESRCVAIGEAGIDTLKGGPLFRQMQLFKKHVEISESLGKPLIIHDVKAHDIILGLHKELNPRQPWIIHGFRAKPSVAKMFTDKGIYLSFGENFNPDTVRETPLGLICAETDESLLPICTIIGNLSSAFGKDLSSDIPHNISQILHQLQIE